MAIEFHCVNCHKLLRVKDESAGKKAKCPECATVLEIPMPGAPPADEYEIEKPAETPFPNFAAERPGQRPDISANPYQSPAAMDTGVTPLQSQAPGVEGVITPTRISAADVFSRAWTTFTEHAGIVIGAMFVVGIIGFAVGFGLMYVISDQLPGVAAAPNWPLLIAIYLAFIALHIFLTCGEGIFVLNVAKRRGPSIADLFKGAPYCLTVFIASVLAYLVLALGSGAVFVPFALVGSLIGPPVSIVITVLAVAFIVVSVIVLMLMFSQFIWLILDQKLGAIRCFIVSQNITAGNKAALFVIVLVAGILPLLVLIAISTVTTMAGIQLIGSIVMFIFQILYMAYALILFATAYLMMTGQISARG